MALHVFITGCRVIDRLELLTLTAEFLDLCSNRLSLIGKPKVIFDRQQTFEAGSFSLKDERWRFDVLVEGLRRTRKAALRIGTVVEFHRDVEHDQVRGGDPSARPRLEQRTR